MFVYVIAVRNGQDKRIKIGHSANPFMRLAQLQTGHPEPLHIIHCAWMMGEMHAKDLEKRLHAELHEYRLQGEWFRTKALKTIKLRATKIHDDGECYTACQEFHWRRYRGTPVEVQSQIVERLKRQNHERLGAETG